MITLCIEHAGQQIQVVGMIIDDKDHRRICHVIFIIHLPLRSITRIEAVRTDRFSSVTPPFKHRPNTILPYAKNAIHPAGI